MDIDVNTVIVSGEVVRAPTTRFTESGTQQTDFTLLAREVSATKQPFSLYVPCQAYGEAATIADTLEKSVSVLVSGKLKWHSHTAKDGSKKSSLTVLVRLVKRLQPAAVDVG